MSLFSLHLTIDDCVCMSAPSSPTDLTENHQKLRFCSLPTSPKDSDLQPQTNPSKDSNSNFDQFEFETRRRFRKGSKIEATDNHCFIEAWSGFRQRSSHRVESLPVMSFADELFCDGKMMPLQVKPPPVLGGAGNLNPIPNSPGSPNSVFKFPFRRRHQSLWNDDFDPFTEALKTIQEEKSEQKRHPRTLSMLPLGIYSYATKKPDPPPEKPNPQVEFEIDTQPSPVVKLTEPRGVLYCWRTRLVKVGNDMPDRKTTIGSEHTMFNGEKSNVDDAGGENKKHKHSKLKKFLLNVIYERKKEKGKIKMSWKKLNRYKRRFSVKLNQIKDEENEEEGEPRMRLNRCKKPKFSLCMGHSGMKYVK